MMKPWNDPRITTPTQLSQYDRRAWLAAGRPPLAFEPEPEPKPAQPIMMNAETAAAWDRWCRGHVSNGLNTLAYVIGAETAKIENRLNKKISELEAEIGSLRAERTVERAARVVDLPNWRKKNDAS
jgi:hypothetical protein